MYTSVFVTLCIATVATVVGAETYYVATDGRADNDGSKERPWDAARIPA